MWTRPRSPPGPELFVDPVPDHPPHRLRSNVSPVVSFHSKQSGSLPLSLADRTSITVRPRSAHPPFQVQLSAFALIQRNLFSSRPSLPPCSSTDREPLIDPRNPLQAAVRDLQAQALLPYGSSIESTMELVVGDCGRESVLRARAGSPSPNIKDVTALSAFCDSPAQPLTVIVLPDRDLACLVDVTNGEFVIEGTGGEPRVVILVGNDFRRHETLGPQEGARVAFAGLAKNKTYTIGLVVPRSPDALIDEAERISESGPKLEALILVERALALDPSLRHAWRRKAYVLRELGRHHEALTAAEESLRIDPCYALGLRCKGAILRDLGEHQLGLECYERSLALDPTDSLCWANKGNALSALGRKRQARKAYAEAKRIGALYPERH